MQDDTIPPHLLALIEQVTAKRPKTVLDHIRQYGYITNIELNQTYGYEHPPRAIRDVRENGIPLERFIITRPDGSKLTAYRFPTTSEPEESKIGGRRSFPKKLKLLLLERDGEQCMICGGKFPSNALQIDHKVPYEVSGDTRNEWKPEEFMLVCGSCNRAKSWTCEHCENWRNIKSSSICTTCMWGSPQNYEHIAMQQKRSLTLNWHGEEVYDYDRLKDKANEAGQNIEEYIKWIIRSKQKENEKTLPD